MTGAASVSVVIVSHDRPEALRRCLIGVGQMTYGQFEVVVDPRPARGAPYELAMIANATPDRLIR